MADDENEFLAREKENDPNELIRNANQLMREQLEEARATRAKEAEREAARKKHEETYPVPVCVVGTIPDRLTRKQIIERAVKTWAEVKAAIPDAPEEFQMSLVRELWNAPEDPPAVAR